MTGTSGPTVGAMRDLLSYVTDGLALRSVGAWAPAFGSSPARREVRATSALLRSDGATPWGPAPIEGVWKASELLYTAVLEHARAAAALMVPPFRTWAPAVAVRAAVEAAAQVAWLLDPSVPSGRTRVGRYYALRLDAAHRLEQAYEQIQPDGPLRDYGASRVEIMGQAETLGLTPDIKGKKNVIGYEGQRPGGPTKIASLIVSRNGAYSVLSGSAHSALWFLLGGYQGQPAMPSGISAADHDAASVDFGPLSRACLQALFKPIDCVCQMFGRQALIAKVDTIYLRVSALLGT